VLFEDSCRIPMIAAIAGETIPGARCNQLIEMVDLYPSFADLCGLTPPENLEGISFRPLLSQPNTKWKQAAFTQVKRGDTTGKSIRTQRWRYTEWRQGQNLISTELYDHTSDPDEYRNLAEMPDFADVCKKLTLLLKNGMNRI
jgi:iduronate 2-sulfatase